MTVEVQIPDGRRWRSVALGVDSATDWIDGWWQSGERHRVLRADGVVLQCRLRSGGWRHVS